MLPHQPQWPPAARAIRDTASHRDPVWGTSDTGTAQIAQASMPSFLPLLILIPPFKSLEENQPRAIPIPQETRYMVKNGNPISFRFTPNFSFRNFAPQKR